MMHSDEPTGEWQLQERALEEERRGVSPHDTQGALAEYRLIARVLREPLSDALPPDFAAHMATQVESAVELENDYLEKWLQRMLSSVLLVAGAIAALVVGGRLVKMLSTSALGTTGLSAATDWIVVAALCCLISSVLERVLRQRH